MTTNATTAEDRLARVGIHLPDAPTPFGAYVPAVQTGKLLFLSAYRRDVPSAQVHVLDAGHFALDTAADEIADFVRRFMSNKQ
jgi:hypothetical protein